jgi:hypothetical protein
MGTVKEYNFEYSKRATVITNSHTAIVQFPIHAIAPFHSAVNIFAPSAEVKNGSVLPPFPHVFTT